MLRTFAALASALALSVSLFLFMAYLIAPPKNITVTPRDLANIEFVDRKETEIEPEQPPEQEPEPEQEPPPPQPKVQTPEIAVDTPALDFPLLDLLPAEFSGLDGVTLAQAAPPVAAPAPEALKLSSEAVAIVSIAPEYPIRLQKRKIEGFVTVEFIVNKKGKAEQIKVIQASPENAFERVVIGAVQRSKYKPVVVEGEVIQHAVRQTFNFSL
jgi:protein TonB